MQYHKLVFIFLMVFATYSCSNKNSLFKDYNCQTKPIKSKIIPDALQKFSLRVPNNWKTKLYIDNNTSIFVTADTTKQLSQTFLIKVSLISGILNFDGNLSTSLKSKSVESFWKTDKIIKGLFIGSPALLFSSIKQNSTINTSALHIFVNAKNQYHFEIKIQCFGEKNRQERFCKAIAIIKTLKLY